MLSRSAVDRPDNALGGVPASPETLDETAHAGRRHSSAFRCRGSEDCLWVSRIESNRLSGSQPAFGMHFHSSITRRCDLAWCLKMLSSQLS